MDRVKDCMFCSVIILTTNRQDGIIINTVR